MSFEYVRNYYGVPAEIGRRVIVDGKAGVIAEDRGHYIGVNFDDDKPSRIYNVHPTDKVQYGEMGKVRKISRSAARYQRYLKSDGIYESFANFLYWDAVHQKNGQH